MDNPKPIIWQGMNVFLGFLRETQRCDWEYRVEAKFLR